MKRSCDAIGEQLLMPSHGITMAIGLGSRIGLRGNTDLSASPGTKTAAGRRDVAPHSTFGIGAEALDRSCSFSFLNHYLPP